MAEPLDTQAHRSKAAMRFFISYRRRAGVDARLATRLHQILIDAGCDVFIDCSIPVGTEWAAEIERRIAWCDYLVVLLSEDSICSEMVLNEVRRAHHLSKSQGRSKVLPVRITYLGSLGYELESYLGKLQYALWQGPEDDNRVAAEILRGALPESSTGSGLACASHNKRPEPKADMRRLRESIQLPGALLDTDNPFYVERDIDSRIEECATGRSRTVVIKGPSQSGKSSLLLRYLRRCLDGQRRVAFVDLALFGDLRTYSFGDFAAQISDVLVRELDLGGITVPKCYRALDLTNFIEDSVLKNVAGDIVIAIDDVDHVIGSIWQEDFYSALRGWDAYRTHPLKRQSWGRLSLTLAIATDPRMLIESGYTSPFNVTVPLMVSSFSRQAINAFNTSHGGILMDSQLDQLYSLVRGHPYLTALAFYRLVADGMEFNELCGRSADEFGPFGSHLRAHLDRIYTSRLHEAMREIVDNGAVPGNDRRLFYRLEAAGLVREDTGRIVSSNDVYHRFFKSVL